MGEGAGCLKNDRVSLLVVLLAAIFVGLSWLAQSALVEDVTFVGGVLSQNQTWSGLIHVVDTVVVPQG